MRYYDGKGNVITFDEALELARQRGACDEVMDLIESLGEGETLRHKCAREWICWYAYNVIGGRWIEAEDVICKDAKWAYWYSRFVIRGRWIEAEDVICKDVKLAAWYAYNVSDTDKQMEI